MKKCIKECYKYLYIYIYIFFFFWSNKLDNLEEMHKSLGTCNIPKLNQEEVYNLNRLTTSSEFELIFKNLLAK